jgi:hypothetical protein
MQLLYRGTMLMTIVDAEVHVRAGMALSSRPRTAQCDRYDPLDLLEPGGYPLS